MAQRDPSDKQGRADVCIDTPAIIILIESFDGWASSVKPTAPVLFAPVDECRLPVAAAVLHQLKLL